MKKLFIILNLIGLFVQAQNIAYVDSRYILENIPEFNIAQEEINHLSIQWEEEINLLKEEVERLYRNYQAEQYLLPEETKRKREEDIAPLGNFCIVVQLLLLINLFPLPIVLTNDLFLLEQY
jgi:outer membrane protein